MSDYCVSIPALCQEDIEIFTKKKIDKKMSSTKQGAIQRIIGNQCCDIGPISDSPADNQLNFCFECGMILLFYTRLLHLNPCIVCSLRVMS